MKLQSGGMPSKSVGGGPIRKSLVVASKPSDWAGMPTNRVTASTKLAGADRSIPLSGDDDMTIVCRGGRLSLDGASGSSSPPSC